MASPNQAENDVLDQCARLLRFAAENKTGLPAQVVTDIEDAWAARAASSWNTPVATKFWTAYDALCTHLRPVNLDTLDAAETVKRSPTSWLYRLGYTTAPSLSRRWARRFLGALIVILFAALWLEYLSATGDIVLSSTQASITQGDTAVKNIQNQIAQRPSEITGATDFDSLALSPESRLWVVNIRQSLLDLWNAADSLYDNANSSVYTWLLVGRYRLCRSNETPTADNCYFKGEIKQPSSLNSILAATGDEGDFYSFFETERVVKAQLRKITSRLAGIKAYLLPALLGMLGACTYVVRTISDQIKDSTFASSSPLRHVLRVALGPIVGVIVVTFLPVSNEMQLSASAWAFIAGYGMEAVFAAFEAIVAKLSK